MAGYPESMQQLIEEFARMPGVGIRTAERFAFYILSLDKANAVRLSDAVLRVNGTIHYCKKCFNLSENELCSVCRDPGRDEAVICVVEEPKDIVTIEKSGAFHGVYHVLLGVLSPLDGVGPQDIKIQELLSRVKKDGVREVLVATTSDTEGEATSVYLNKVLKPLGVKITRLAQGVPVGSALEFADRATLMRAIQARQEIST